MWVEFKLFIIPFLIAMGQVLFSALAIGMFPGLWVLMRAGRWGAFCKWLVVTAICVTAVVYALPLALREWKDSLTTYKSTGTWLGYLVPLLFVPMIIPEPLRIARRKVRKGSPEEKVRRKRRKRRSQQIPGEVRIR